jgi:CRISPR-associated protein Csb2
LLAGDVAWAFSGIVLSDSKADGAGEVIVSPTLEQTAMPGHYGIANGSVHRVWRTVTPAALPIEAARRRIDPKRMHDEAKSGWERVQECTRAATAVVQALRHAEVSIGVRRIRVQREPFEAKGQRAEAFAEGTRFSKHQVWHIEIEFTEGISGPVIIGNGRFLGLGIMAPVPDFYVDPPEQMSSQLADLAFE